MLREGWADYYENLATPKTKPEWNADKLAEAKSKKARRVEICKSAHRTTSFKQDDVVLVLKSLNKGKSADMDGIRAEHLKDPSDSQVEALAEVFDDMLMLEPAKR